MSKQRVLNAVVVLAMMLNLVSVPVFAAPPSAPPAMPMAAPAREEFKAVQAQGTDPIPDYLSQISEANLTTTVAALVGYGPRLVNEHYVYTDASCTYGTQYYDENNLDRAADYAKGVLDAMGYTAVLEPVSGYGHNVVATKIGTVYPNIYIEFGAHLDTKPGTPGGNDNASGSAAVMELARVLKDYPSRYSMTFALWVGEETGGFAGAYYHIDQMIAAGKQIKAGLNLDNMGQIGAGNIYRDDVWTNNAASLNIWDIFNQVNTQYSLGLTLVNNANPCCSDGHAYWARGLTSVTSVGGWTPSSPNYHGCGDVVANFTPTQGAKVTQLNLAGALKLDLDIVPPTVTLVLSPDTIPANGTSTSTATATVKDSNGNPLASETVAFTTSGDVSISAVTNHGDGTYGVTLTASTTAGPETITATDSGVSATATLVETTYCPGACFTDTTFADFGAGTAGSSTYVAQMGDGDVILQPTVGAEFSGSSLPSGWVTSDWNGTQSVTFSGGWVALQNAKLNTSATFGPGRTIEFAAKFGGGTYQFGGLSDNGSSAPWAGFDFDVAGTTLTANENNAYITSIPGSWVGTSHRYRIDWNVAPNAGDIVYYIDGVEVARHAHSETGAMRPMFTDYAADGQPNQVDWVHMSPYASSGMFYSRVFDGGGAANWGLVTWTAETPSGTGIVVSARTGNTAAPDGTWSDFIPVSNGASVGANARYLQYRAELSTSNPNLTAALNEISLRYSPGTVGPATQLGFITQPAGAIAGSPFATQPVVAVQDASGYTVSSDNSTQVTLAIGTNPSGGVLTCTANPVTVINGVANFAGCRIDKAGTGYTLVATGGSLASATSGGFNVTHVAPASMTLVLSPDTIGANGTSTSIATTTVRDAGGNPLVGETVVFSTNGDVTFGPVTDNGNGTYSVSVTASTTPGDETITATDSPVSASTILHETANCPGICYTDTTVTDFSSGTPGTSTYVAQTTDGEVILAPTVGAEFYGTTLPAGWSVLPYGGGSPSVAVSGGWVSVGTARLRADGLYGPGHVLEYVATHTGGLYQAGGLGYSFDGGDGYVWATFDTAGVGTALNTNTNGTVTSIPGSWLNSPHRYRIEWTTTGVVYYIDGIQRDSKLVTFARDMRPLFADNVADANLLQLDWVRMSPYASTGTFLSRVMDGGGPTDWGIASWTAETPAGTSVALSVHSGNTPIPDGTWTSFSPITNGSSIGVHARYLQYLAVLATSNTDVTPVLKDICISYVDNTPPTIVSRSPAPGATDVAVSTAITLGFSEPMLASTISTSTIRLRASGAPSDVPATVTYAGTTATLTPSATLAPARQYQVTVAGIVSDLHGNQLGSDVTWSFNTATAGSSFTDTTVADFTAGTPGSGIYIAQMNDGEVILQPTMVSEFSGTSLPSDWSSTGSVSVSGGWLTLNTGATARTNATYGPGRSIEYGATLGGGQYQAVGFASSVTSPPYAVFDFVSSDGATLYAFYNTGSGNNGPVIPGEWRNSAHRYRIDWGASSLAYYIDGTPKATPVAAISGNMYAFLSAQSQVLKVDWVRMSPYATSGTFLSRVFDAGGSAAWGTVTYTADIPTNTSLTVGARTGDTYTPDSSWSDFTVLAGSGVQINRTSRYIQYRAMLTTSDPDQTPVLKDITLNYRPNTAPLAVDDAYSLSQDTVLTVATPGVLINDTDAELDPLTAIRVADPAHGMLTLNPNGSFTYTPNSGFTGDDTFTYNANDGAADSNIAMVTIHVNAVTPPPLPSSFYGEIHISDNPPQAGDTVEAHIAGVTRAITTTITVVSGGALTYKLDVPGDVEGTPEKEGGVEGDAITFTVNSRVVAYAAWHSGTNTRLDFHLHGVTLQPGWNLVSFNLIPGNADIATVLTSVAGNYDLVYAWNAQTQGWLKYDNVPGSPDTLSNLDEKMGFWIHMTAADQLDAVGSIPSTTNINLYAVTDPVPAPGWNLVGYPANSNGALPAALRDHGVDADFLQVYAYHANDPNDDPWKLYDESAPEWANDLTALSPLWGYWVRVNANRTWHVEYP